MKQTPTEIAITLKYESDAPGSRPSGNQSDGGGRPLATVFTLDGKLTQTPDSQDARPAYNYKRIATWDGARLVLRTVHGLNNVREVWVLENGQLKMQRAAQTPGGADSATRNLVYTR